MTYTTGSFEVADDFNGQLDSPGDLRRVPLLAAFRGDARRLERYIADHMQDLGDEIGFWRLGARDYSPENKQDEVNHIAAGEVVGHNILADSDGKVALKAVMREARPADVRDLLRFAREHGLSTAIFVAEEFSAEALDDLCEISHGYERIIAAEMRAWTLDGDIATPCFRAVPAE